MRISKVVGKVTLVRQLRELPAGTYLLVRTLNRGSLAGVNEGNDESEVVYDSLAAREGDLIGMVEGTEATAPFWPKKVPFNTYNACILERVHFQPVLEVHR
jgi:microcompartment protein CcmK/EutM